MATYVNTFRSIVLEILRVPNQASGMLLGDNIRRLRKARRSSLTVMERKTGIDRSKLSAIENSRHANLTLKTLLKIAEEGLDVEVAELFLDADGGFVSLPEALQPSEDEGAS